MRKRKNERENEMRMRMKVHVTYQRDKFRVTYLPKDKFPVTYLPKDIAWHFPRMSPTLDFAQ